MSGTTVQDQLVKYLQNAHSLEEQALIQMKRAPKLVSDIPQLKEAFHAHIAETEHHERLTRERLEAHGKPPALLKDELMKAGGVGFTLFAAFQPDTPGKLTAHAFSYEHLEMATYAILSQLAGVAGDGATVIAAQEIEAQEREMARRLEACFTPVVDYLIHDKDIQSVRETIPSYLTDAHAIEQQSIVLLKRALGIRQPFDLEEVYEQHLAESQQQCELIEALLHRYAETPSKIKDSVMRLGALNWAGFFQSQSNTVAKLAAFTYAYEYLEIGGYEQLFRIAEKIGDDATHVAIEHVIEQEHQTADKISSCFGEALQFSLEAEGVKPTLVTL